MTDSRKAAQTPPDSKPELARLFEETVALYLRLSATARQIYRKGELSGPRRTVLTAIARSGPQTVSQLARTRSEARQRFQPIVTALVRDRLLRYVRNPAHRRSPLVSLTRKGESAVERIRDGESLLRARTPFPVETKEVLVAVDVLRRVRHTLESPATERLIDAHRRKARSAGR